MISNSNTTNQTTSKRLPSPAMIVSLLALFVALSGTAFAIEANSIASKHVRDDSLKSEDLKDGAGVTGDDIQAESIGDGPLGLDSVGPGDLQEDAVRTYNISDGHVTVSDIGFDAVGAQELQTVHLRLGDVVTISPGDSRNGDWGTGESTVSCEPDEVLLAAAGRFGGNEPDDEVALGEIDIFTEGNPDFAKVEGLSDRSGNINFRATATCLDA